MKRLALVQGEIIHLFRGSKYNLPQKKTTGKAPQNEPGGQLPAL